MKRYYTITIDLKGMLGDAVDGVPEDNIGSEIQRLRSAIEKSLEFDIKIAPTKKVVIDPDDVEEEIKLADDMLKAGVGEAYLNAPTLNTGANPNFYMALDNTPLAPEGAYVNKESPVGCSGILKASAFTTLMQAREEGRACKVFVLDHGVRDHKASFFIAYSGDDAYSGEDEYASANSDGNTIDPEYAMRFSTYDDACDFGDPRPCYVVPV